MKRLIRTATLSSIAVAVCASMAIAATPAQSGEPSVTVFDQAATGTSVNIHYVNLTSKGYIAVYAADAEGKPTRTPLGSAELAAGSYRDIKVTLKDAPKSGQRMWVALHSDSDGKPGFDPAADALVGGQAIPLENAFAIR